MITITEKGYEHINAFVEECRQKRKEVLDAKKDTANDTNLPTYEDILADISFTGVDSDGCYTNGWGVTDNTDLCISLELGLDFVYKFSDVQKLKEHILNDYMNNAEEFSSGFFDGIIVVNISGEELLKMYEELQGELNGDYLVRLKNEDKKLDTVSGEVLELYVPELKQAYTGHLAAVIRSFETLGEGTIYRVDSYNEKHGMLEPTEYMDFVF